MKIVKVKVTYPVYFEIEVSDKDMDEIQSGDLETIEKVKEEIKEKADYFLQSSSISPAIECDSPNLND